MKKNKTSYNCLECGYQSPKWLGKCPSCGGWNRFAEEETPGPQASWRYAEGPGQIRGLEQIEPQDRQRLGTGIAEMDRVLGGGLVGGSAILVGGEPGIGKSTLMLQIMEKLALQGLKVLYVSGEESARQIKLRADRIGAGSANILILTEIDLEEIIRQGTELSCRIMVVDSIQAVSSQQVPSAPGSVNQIRECAARLISLGKRMNIPVFLTGHVTKEGAIAGPKILEHMVDTVLYFEGDAGHQYRIVRAIKNRFGPTNEIGVFEMGSTGLTEVVNPSAFFLADELEKTPGSAVAVTMEGTRPILVEIQSLVLPNNFGVPRRTTNGVDHNRVALLVAVMDKVGGYRLTSHDVFVNVVGGIKIDEPAVDLGMVASLLSSLLDRPAAEKTAIFGEVGLTGEIRAVSQAATRLNEAKRMGFRRCLMPASRGADTTAVEGITIIAIRHLRELAEHLF